MSQTCPICRGAIGHIKHPQLSITDEQRDRVRVLYKIFYMTEDNPELSNLQVVMRETALGDRTVRTGWPMYNNMKVYLLVKGFEYFRTAYGIMCKSNSEETRYQIDAMRGIPGYDVVSTKSAEFMCLKEDRDTRYFMDSVIVDRSNIPKHGILNAIVRPRYSCYQGRNQLHFIITQVECEKLRDLKPDEIIGESNRSD